jgi:hypothetical protein
MGSGLAKVTMRIHAHLSNIEDFIPIATFGDGKKKQVRLTLLLYE